MLIPKYSYSPSGLRRAFGCALFYAKASKSTAVHRAPTLLPLTYMIISINKIEADLRVLWQDWKKNAKDLARKSLPSFLLLLLSQTIFGFLPYLTFTLGGRFLDALIGARSLMIWTQSMTDMVWIFIGWMILVSCLILITRIYRKSNSSVARGIRWFVFLTSTFFFLFQASPMLIFIISLLLITEIWIVKSYRSLVWIIISLCLLWLLSDFLHAIVYHQITIGTGLALISLLLIIPARQFIDRYFVSHG